MLVPIRSVPLSDAHITVLPWPAMSPDLNPIGHLWAQLKRSLKTNYSDVPTRQKLINALKVCWVRIPAQNITLLIESGQIGSESAFGVEDAPLVI